MAFDSRLSILFSLFQGNKVFRDVLESRRSTTFEYIVDLIKIVEVFDQGSNQIGKLKEFDRLKKFLLEGVSEGARNFGKH